MMWNEPDINTIKSVKNDLTISLEAARLWGNKGKCACHELSYTEVYQSEYVLWVDPLSVLFIFSSEKYFDRTFHFINTLS